MVDLVALEKRYAVRYQEFESLPLRHEGNKMDFLEKVFSEIDLSQATILDAGTGRQSFEFLTGLRPCELIGVAYPGDLRKGEKVEAILSDTKNPKYKLIYGDLAQKSLFLAESFDYILAHLLLGELVAGKVEKTIANLFDWLRPGGQVFFVDREFYQPKEVLFKYQAMGKITGGLDLSSRSNRDLYEIVGLVSRTARELKLLSLEERSFDYPSSWVESWLRRAGFRNIEIKTLVKPEKLKSSFLEEVAWAQERIGDLLNEESQKGLLKELEQVVEEFERRKISDEEIFSRRLFVCRAKK